MKKLILSTVIVLIAFSGFSQKDTTHRVNDSTVKIPVNTARSIAKDLVLKDFYYNLYTIYYQKDSLNQLRINLKDSTIKDYQELDSNNIYMLSTTKKQLEVDKTTIKILNRDLKIEKWKKWGGITIGVIGGYFLGHNIFK